MSATVAIAEAAEEAPSRPGRLKRLARAARQQPLGAAGAAVLLGMVVVAILAPWIAPYDPIEGDPTALYVPPNAQYWLGTDAFGRDMLSRLIHGARVSLLVGLGASLSQ